MPDVYWDMIYQQRKEEKDYVEQKSSFCPLPRLENRVLNTELIQSSVLEGIMDDKVLFVLMCANNMVGLYPDKSADSMRIRKYLQNLRKIGEESTDGIAMVASVDTQDNQPFVIKTSKLVERWDISLHEYFIGAFGTNQLRSRIPNFAYIYGLFKCSPPYINGKKVLAFCQNQDPQNQTNYVMYENIRKSQTLNEFIRSGCNWIEYMQVFSQVVAATEMGYHKCDYTHYDLHLSNLLVTKHKEPICIEYIINKQKYYLQSRFVVHIIDYGRSHIKYKGKHYGSYNPEYNIYPDQSYPMYDVFKVFMGSLYSGLQSNNQLFDDIYLIASYWYKGIIDKDDVIPLLYQGVKNFFALGPGFEGSLSPFWDYLYQSNTTKSFIFTRRPKIPVYGCLPNNTCMSVEDGINMLTLNESEQISDPYIFIDIIQKSMIHPGSNQSRIENPKFQTYNRLLILGEKYRDKYIQILQNSLNVNLNELEQLVKSVSPLSLRKNISPQLKINKNVIDLYQSFVARVASCSDLLTDIEYDLDTMKSIIDLYPDDKLYRKYEGYVFISNELSRSVVKWLKIIDQDIETAEKIGIDQIAKSVPNSVLSEITSATKALSPIMF